MTAEPLYVFFHLPKTGGTTFTGHLNRHLAPEQVLMLGPGADRHRAERGIPLPSEWPPERLAPVRVITGHGADARSHLLFPGRPARHLTFVRDPAPLVVSRFNFDVSRSGEDIDFDAWLAEQRPDPTFRRLGRLLGVDDAAAVAEALAGFWFVGVTEHLDDDLPRVFGAMGLPTGWVNRRVAGGGADTADLDLPGAAEAVAIRRHAVLTDDLAARLREMNPRDVEVHRLALEVRAVRRAALGWEAPA